MITFYVWKGCQWVKVTATRAVWRALPHVRAVSLVGCGAVAGVLPPLPSHVPLLPPVAPPHSAEVVAPPVPFFGYAPPATGGQPVPTAVQGGACCWQPVSRRDDDGDEGEGEGGIPRPVPESPFMGLLMVGGLFLVGLGRAVRKYG